MLAVKPVYDKETAAELCRMCKVEYHDDEYTYFAADVNDDATKVNFIIGVCTVKIKGNVNEFCALASVPGVDDEEALIIMARTAMNFMYRCEVKILTAGKGVNDYFAHKLGFSDDRTLDLEEFYKAPCRFNK